MTKDEVDELKQAVLESEGDFLIGLLQLLVKQQRLLLGQLASNKIPTPYDAPPAYIYHNGVETEYTIGCIKGFKWILNCITFTLRLMRFFKRRKRVNEKVRSYLRGFYNSLQWFISQAFKQAKKVNQKK